MAAKRSVIEAARDYIDRYYAEGIQLQHVAKALSYTPSHLTYLVRIATGKPVNVWIIERRIEQAKVRLLSTSDTVATIGEDVGFRDVTYFGRQFSRVTGLSPTRWRSEFRGSDPTHGRCPACGTHRLIETA